MIVLVTDFGLGGPYVGQMLRVLHEQAPDLPVVNLFADAPAWNPKATAYLLASYTAGFAAGTVFLCVVDPAVGSNTHMPVVAQCDGFRFVGPDNGLFEIVRRRAEYTRTWRIDWKPGKLSASFHGRDLYAPIAACVAQSDSGGLKPVDPLRFPDWPDDLAEVIYIDHYGNAMTGLRAAGVSPQSILEVRDAGLSHAQTFAAAAAGQAFWYENANGLVEIAANRARAAEVLGLNIGTQLKMRIPA